MGCGNGQWVMTCSGEGSKRGLCLRSCIPELASTGCQAKKLYRFVISKESAEKRKSPHGLWPDDHEVWGAFGLKNVYGGCSRQSGNAELLPPAFYHLCTGLRPVG